MPYFLARDFICVTEDEASLQARGDLYAGHLLEGSRNISCIINILKLLSPLAIAGACLNFGIAGENGEREVLLLRFLSNVAALWCESTAIQALLSPVCSAKDKFKHILIGRERQEHLNKSEGLDWFTKGKHFANWQITFNLSGSCLSENGSSFFTPCTKCNPWLLSEP